MRRVLVSVAIVATLALASVAPAAAATKTCYPWWGAMSPSGVVGMVSLTKPAVRPMYLAYIGWTGTTTAWAALGTAGQVAWVAANSPLCR